MLGILGAEFERTEAAILAVTGQRRLLGREPVLLRSVELRNPYIDPLNYIQVDMMRRLREPRPAAAAGGRGDPRRDRAHDQRDQRRASRTRAERRPFLCGAPPPPAAQA